MIADNICYQNDHVMTETSEQLCSKRFHDRVLTLILLGGVDVLPTVYPPNPGVMGGLCESRSPSHVMVTAGCLLGIRSV